MHKFVSINMNPNVTFPDDGWSIIAVACAHPFQEGITRVNISAASAFGKKGETGENKLLGQIRFPKLMPILVIFLGIWLILSHFQLFQGSIFKNLGATRHFLNLLNT